MMLFFLYLVNILLSSNIVVSREAWIDPHDMNDKRSTVWHNIAELNTCECPIMPISECDSSYSSKNVAISHYKRVINLLLDAVVVDPTDRLNYRGQLQINVLQEDYQQLQNFAKNNLEDSATLRAIDMILSRMLIKPSYVYLAEGVISWIDHIYFTFYNRSTGILLACMFLLLLSYKLLKTNLTIWAVTKYLIFLGWVIDFAFRWISLLQDAEINKLADSLKYSSIPPHCDPNKMTIWQYIRYTFGSTDSCRDYHQILLKNNFWDIGPVTVLSHQLGTLVFTPARYFGAAMGSFTNGILNNLPWGVNIVLLPVLVTFSAIIMCIIFSFVTQTSIRFSIFHILQLEFAKNERHAISDILYGGNLSAVVNTIHRNMIEEVRQSTVENTITSEVSSFRNVIDNKIVNEEPKNDCENIEQEAKLPESSLKITHTGGGDQVKCLDH